MVGNAEGSEGGVLSGEEAAAAARAKAMAASAAAVAAAKRALSGMSAAGSSTPAWMSEMMELEEETGLTCMVCHEGYRCKVREATQSDWSK